MFLQSLSTISMACRSLTLPPYSFSLRLIALSLTLLASSAVSAFDLDDVTELARKRATDSFQPGEPIPDFMRDIDYSRYRSISFDPQRTLWRGNGGKFQVQMLPAGSFYRRRVKLNIIDSEGVHPLPFDKSLFRVADAELAKTLPADLGFAGFQLLYPGIAETNDSEQGDAPFLTFAGGSYFQAVGRGQRMGAFSRGIAIDTGLSSGEEFPDFVEFWLERPTANATSMRLYALLDGESLTGAYEFVVTPGDATRIAVRSRLFLRRQPQVLGLAPLTAMYFHGENSARPAGHWRPRVHDANGLLIHDGASNEWLWRPLINPINLQTDLFVVKEPRGFGLMQRNRRFEEFQDNDARYDLRPSVWITPKGDWGSGHIALVQLPAPNDTNRNIVAFFQPDQRPPIGQALHCDYEIQFGDYRIGKAPLARSINTFVADAHRIDPTNEPGAYLLTINFSGDELTTLRRDAAVIANVTALDEGRVLRQYVEYLAPMKGWRLTVLAKPADGRALSLRAFLSLGGAENSQPRTLSETWSYRLPPNNDILQAAP